MKISSFFSSYIPSVIPNLLPSLLPAIRGKTIPQDVVQNYYAPDPILESISKENTSWRSFKDKFMRKSEFRKSIESMANNFDASSQDALSKITSAFTSVDYYMLRKPLRNILKKLETHQLGEIFNQLIDKGVNGKGLDGLHKCLSLLTPTDLERILEKGIQESSMTPEKTLEVFALAEKEYRKLVTSTEDSLPKKHEKTFGRMVRNFIDGCLMSFRIYDIGKEVTSPWEAGEKLQAYTKIIGVPVLIFTALCTVCPLVVALVVTAAIVATSTLAIVVYLKWFQEGPENIDPCVNLVNQAREGALTPVLARETEIDEILHSLASSSDSHRAHPLLVGPSGVGKTEIVRGIAQRLAIGNVPDSLKGKKLLSINTADLFDKFSSGSGDDKLQSILNKMGKRKSDYIVFFDEIHNAMINKLEVGERLKTVLDTNPNSLPFCIAATTEDEYEKYIAPNLAFARRFQKMDVQPTSMKQTVLIMREMIKREAPEISISDETLEIIYEKSTEKFPSLFQPFSAKHVLAKVISSSKQESSPLIQIKQQELTNLSSALHSDPTSSRGEETLERMRTLQQEIHELIEQKNKDAAKSREIKQLRKFKSEQVSQAFKMALNATVNGSGDDKFKFWNYYLLPYVNEKIETYYRENHAQPPVEIDEQFIDTLLANETPEA